MSKRVIFSIAIIFLIALLSWFLMKPKKKENTGSVDVGDLEQFRVDEQGNILMLQDGVWTIQE